MLLLKVYDANESEWKAMNLGYVYSVPEKYRWSSRAVDNKDGQAMTGEALLNFVNNELFPALKKLEIDETSPMSKVILRTAFEDSNNYSKDGILLRQVVDVIDELDFEEYADRKEISVDGFDKAKRYTVQELIDRIIAEIEAILGVEA